MQHSDYPRTPTPVPKVGPLPEREPSEVKTSFNLDSFTTFDGSLRTRAREHSFFKVDANGSFCITADPAGEITDKGHTHIVVKLSPNGKTIIVITGTTGMELRAGGGNQARSKKVSCKAIMHELKKKGIQIPAFYTPEYDAKNQYWIGRLIDTKEHSKA